MFSRKLLHEVLTEITGNWEYKFNLKAIIVDKHEENFSGVREMFGVVIWRVISCQMHYESDVNKVEARVGGLLKVMLRNMQ